MYQGFTPTQLIKRAGRFGENKLQAAKDIGNEALDKGFEAVAKQAIGVAQETGALLDQTNAFARTAVNRGTNVAKGLANDAGAFAKAKVNAVANFFGVGDRRRRRAAVETGYLGPTPEQAIEFFSGCIAFCNGPDDIVSVTVTLTDPLVLDLDGDGIGILPISESDVFFDMSADGTLNHVSWIDETDAFLARDLNGNGLIDDARELFGSKTDGTSQSGFEALLKLDANADGRIDATDPLFASLMVWRDANVDGMTQDGELKPLADYKIVSLPVAKIPYAASSSQGDIVYGGDVVVTKGAPDDDAKPPFLFEVGLTTLSDPAYIQGKPLANGVRQYFGKDGSRLLVLQEKSTDANLITRMESRAVFGSSFPDVLDGSEMSPVFIKGYFGDDVITGGDRTDMLDGGVGADQIDGGAGNDMLWIDSDDTLVQGGAGFDVAFVERAGGVTLDMFKSSIEVLYGGIGDDTITMSGGANSVRILAGPGDDSVSTGAGDDYIDPGPGNDFVDGGDGIDTVKFLGNLDEYTIKVDKDKQDRVRVTVTDQVESRDDDYNDGTSVLVNVEKLQFDDQAKTLDGRNNAPVIPFLPKRVIRGSKPLSLAPFELLSLAVDFDGEPLTLAGVGPATNAKLALLSDETIVFTPSEGFTGLATLAFTVQDPNGSAATGVLTFVVKPPLPEDELFDNQWYHDNIRSVPVWDSGITGKGVTVRVNDDAIQMNHPDLVNNLDEANSFDFARNQKDPTPADDSGDNHGTFVTGCIVASRNKIGIVGVAYSAIARFSCSFSQGAMDDADVINLSWSQRPSHDDPKKRYNTPASIWDSRDLSGGYLKAIGAAGGSPVKMINAAKTGRGGLGTIVVTSGGNDRLDFDRSGSKMIQSTRHTMAIAAHDKFNRIAYFSSKGANVFVSCPGKDITSTDRVGDLGYSKASDKLSIGVDYANGQGTSYSAPICAGIVALMLEARPALGWRDVQEIMAFAARTSNANGDAFQTNDAGQVLNGGGFKSNEDFGFGLADALGAVRLAESWLLSGDVGSQASNAARTSANEMEDVRYVSPSLAVPDNGQVSSTIKVAGLNPEIRVMSVEVGVKIVHARIGDLVVTITSPAGTVGTIVHRSLYDEDDPDDFGSQNANIFHRFTSARQWGEAASGEWTLTVSDEAAGEAGTLSSWELKLIGDAATPNSLYVFNDDFNGMPNNAKLTDSNGGTDTINTSPIQSSVIVDLTPGVSGATTIRGSTLVIDSNTVIENCFTGDGDDTLIGNSAANVMKSGRGDDELYSSPGGDVLDGGPGSDVVDYSASTAAVTVNLASPSAQQGGYAEGDTLVSIESAVGSAGNDFLTGTNEANTLEGGAGNDVLGGGGGDDVLKGGNGNDILNGDNGDDTLHPGLGANDAVNGGDGVDTVVLLGHSTDYTITYSGDGTTATVTVTDGTNKVTVKTVEFARFSDKTVLLKEQPNAPPQIKPGGLTLTMAEDSALTIPMSSVTGAATDAEGDRITFAYLIGATAGKVVLTETIQFIPEPYFNGDATLSVALHDNHGNSVTVVVQVAVTPVNSKPSSLPALISFPAVSTLSIDSAEQGAAQGFLVATDVDVGDTLTFAVAAPPAVGSVTIKGDGAFVFEGRSLKPGVTTSFAFTATDSGGLSCTGVVSVQVTGLVKSQPVAKARDNSFVEVTTPEEAAAQFSYDYLISMRSPDSTVKHSTYIDGKANIGSSPVIVLASGDIVYTWAAVGIDKDGLGIASKLFDSRGNAITPRFKVNSFEDSEQNQPAAAALANGGFIIVWTSQRQDSSLTGVYFQLYDRLGFRVGKETRANVETYHAQQIPAVTAFSTGGFVIGWQSQEQDGDQAGVFAVMFDELGSSVSDEFQVNTETRDWQDHVQFSALPSGRWIAVWQSLSQNGGNGYDIYAQLFDSTTALVPFGDEFIVATSSESIVDNRVVALPPKEGRDNGGFFITFTDFDESPGPADFHDVSGVVITADGVRVGDELRINQLQPDYARSQVNAALVYVPGVGPVAIWDGNYVVRQVFNDGKGGVLDFSGGQASSGVPRDAQSNIFDTQFTLNPTAAASAFNQGLVVGYQETDFVAKTTTQRLSLLINSKNVRLTAPLTLLGGPGADTLVGDVEDDLFLGNGGDDFYDGKQVLSNGDTVVYLEPRSNFVVSKLGPALWTVLKIATAELDTLKGIELIQFSNTVLRINTAPVAADDRIIVANGKGSVNMLDNDLDAEDGALSADTIVVVVQPEYGKATINGDGLLTVVFSPGDVIAFASLKYQVTDSAGLVDTAVVRIIFPCAGVVGTDSGEIITTGTSADASECDNSFTLQGNAGSDVFTFVKRDGGNDVVSDFALQEDRIALIGFKTIKSFEQVLLSAVQVGSDTKLVLEDVHAVTLQGVTATQLSAANFDGQLGKAPLLVNTYKMLRGDNQLGNSRKLNVHSDAATIRATDAAVRGSINLAELRVEPKDYTQSLIVWDSFPNKWPNNPSGAQDGSDGGVYGQFIGVDGERRGAEFRINKITQNAQFGPIVARNMVYGWFRVLWNQVDAADGSDVSPGIIDSLTGPFKSASGFSASIKSTAIIYDGEAMCTLEAYSNCKSTSRGIQVPATTWAGPYSNAMLSDAVIVNSANRPNAGQSYANKVDSGGWTFFFYYRTPTFCCALIGVNSAVTGSLVDGKQNSGVIRIDNYLEEPGTKLPEEGESHGTAASLSYDKSATNDCCNSFSGQSVVIGWVRNLRFKFFGPTAVEPNLGSVQTIAQVLAFKTVNSFTGVVGPRVDVQVFGPKSAAISGGVDPSTGIVAYGTTSAYRFVSLPANAVPPSSTVDGFEQFMLVHGLRLQRIDSAERIAISTYVKTTSDQNQNTKVSHVLISRTMIDSVDFNKDDPSGSRSLAMLGLSACAVPTGIAIAWGYKFASEPHPVVLVQLFDYEGEPKGPHQIVSGYSPGDGGSTHPKVELTPAGGAIDVVWHQVKSLQGPAEPFTNIYKKQIKLADITNEPPQCVQDTFSMLEDTTLELNFEDLIGNDADFEGGQLTLIDVEFESDEMREIAPGGSVLTGAPSFEEGPIVFQRNLDPTTYIFKPRKNAFGSATLKYTIADDRGQRCSASIAVTVEPVNDAPVATDDLYEHDPKMKAIAECCASETDDQQTSCAACDGLFTEIRVPLRAGAGAAGTFRLHGILDNDKDIDGYKINLLKLTDTDNLLHGQINTATDAAFVYTITSGYKVGDLFYYSEEDTIGYVIEDADPDNDRASATVRFKVRVPLTTCLAGASYETKPPSANADRACSRCSTCTAVRDGLCLSSGRCIAAGSYEKVGCTLETDAVCSPLSSCNLELQYERNPPPSKASVVSGGDGGGDGGALYLVGDRECSDLTVCSINEYESTEPTGSTDRACLPFTACKDGEFEMKLPVPRLTDRICQEFDGCPPTTFISTAATTTTNQKCDYCKLGVSYQPKANQPSCIPVEACDETEYASTPATLSSDRKCSKYTPPCNLRTEFESAPPASNADRACTAMSTCTQDVTFEVRRPSQRSDRECAAATQCDVDEYEVVRATLMSDRVCNVLLKCKVGSEFESIAPSKTSDRKCTASTICGVEFETFEVSPLAAKADRQCNALRVCTATEFESEPPTAQSDRVCTSITQCDAPRLIAARAATATADTICVPADACGGALSGQFISSPVPLADLTSITCSNVRGPCDTTSQFESVSADRLTDRQCASLTVCANPGMAEYELTPPSPTSDRVCMPLRACKAGASTASSSMMSPPASQENKDEVATVGALALEYEIKAPTMTSDRACAFATVCNNTVEYERQPLNATADRICQKLTQCDIAISETDLDVPPPGTRTIEVWAPTKTTDRVCAPSTICDWNTTYLNHKSFDFDMLESNALRNTWKNWGIALDDEEFALAASATAKAVSYQQARSYGMPESIFAEVDANTDGELDQTERDAFRQSERMQGSNAMSTTAEAAMTVGMASAPTITDDWTCTALTRPCAGGSYELVSKSIFRDRFCGTVTVCLDSEIEMEAPSSSSDRICMPLVVLGDDTYTADEAVITGGTDGDGNGARDGTADVSNTSLGAEEGPVQHKSAGKTAGYVILVLLLLCCVVAAGWFGWRKWHLEPSATLARTSSTTDTTAASSAFASKNRMSMYSNPTFKQTNVAAESEAPTQIVVLDGSASLTPIAEPPASMQVTVETQGGASEEVHVPVDADVYTPAALLPTPSAEIATAATATSGTTFDRSNTDAEPLSVLVSAPAPPAPAPAPAPVPAPREVPRQAPVPVHAPATTTSPNLGVMHIYFHGAIGRGEAEEILRATGANFRYLFRAKNSTSVVMSVRYTAGGKHKVQHSMMSQAMPAGLTTTPTYLLDGKDFNDLEAGASFADALKAMVSATAKRIGKQLYPVRNPNQADAANAGNNAVGGYQNTSWECMDAFISDLPQMDRTHAEALLTAKGVDGGFILRVKTAQNVVVSCMVAPGKFEHKAISLAESLGGQSAAWVHRGIEVEERSLIEAARGILRDAHVMNATWIGGGSGVFSSDA